MNIPAARRLLGEILWKAGSCEDDPESVVKVSVVDLRATLAYLKPSPEERLKAGLDLCHVYRDRGELAPGSQAWNIFHALLGDSEEVRGA